MDLSVIGGLGSTGALIALVGYLFNNARLDRLNRLKEDETQKIKMDALQRDSDMQRQLRIQAQEDLAMARIELMRARLYGNQTIIPDIKDSEHEI